MRFDILQDKNSSSPVLKMLFWVFIVYKWYSYRQLQVNAFLWQLQELIKKIA